MKFVTPLARAFTGILFLLVGAALARATTINYHVAFDTSSLSSPFYVDFQFVDGSGVGNANNTATLSNFDFGGGSLIGAPTAFGSFSGSFASGITLTDSDFFTEIFQSFAPGSTLSFDVTLTNTIESPAPDVFSFAILDGSLANIPTTHPTNNSLFYVELGSSPVLSSGTGNFNGITSIASPVPDSGPSVWYVVLLGICGTNYVRRHARDRVRLR